MKRSCTQVILFSIILSLSLLFRPAHCTSGERKGNSEQISESAPMDLTAISRNDMKDIIETLSSDDFEGREAEARGGRLTSVFISSWLSAAEVPGWNGGHSMQDYLQQIPCIAADASISNSFIILKKQAGIGKIFPLESEVYFSPQSPESFTFSAPIVFAGYGISAPEYNYDDYGAFDAKGKIVIAFNHEPQEKDEKSIFRGTKATRYSMPQVKAQIAKERGALALVIMRDRNNPHRSMGESLAQKGTKEERGHFIGIESSDPQIPIFYIEDTVADEIFAQSGIDLRMKQAEIDRTLKSEPVILRDRDLTLTVMMKDTKRVNLGNIIAKVEGSDSRLKEEAIIVGAHYDHLGTKQEGVYRGADDNASGVAALLDIARACSRNPEKPRRSIYFAFFAAEEKGVIGSKYLSEHLPVPKEKVSAMINLDEIGRNNMDKESNANMAIAYMSGQAPELKEIVKKENGSIGLDMKYHPTLRFLTNSDHTSFHDMGIPVIFFFSGFHSDYHKVNDTADKINYPKLEKLARLVFLTVSDIASKEKRIQFDSTIRQEPEKDEFEKPY